MINNSPIQDEEISLIEVLKDIWDERIKIVLISIITILIGISYYFLTSYQIPKSFKNTLVIKESRNKEFVKLKPFIASMEAPIILKRFIRELMDYEELISVLMNNEKIRKNIINLPINDQRQELFKIASQRMTINYLKSGTRNEDPNSKSFDYTLEFVWEDAKEGRDIIDQALKLTLKNLESGIFNEQVDRVKTEKIFTINADIDRIDYLMEQSLIAKELNIADNTVDFFNLSETSVSFNVNASDVAYYLRGHRAIDKEISIIKNRKYRNLNNLYKEVELLKKMNIRWIDYNIYLIKTVALKKSKLKIFIISSTILGLIIGIFYVLVSNAFRSLKLKSKI